MKRESCVKAWSHERLGLSRDEAGKLIWACERQAKFGFNSVSHRDISETIGCIKYISRDGCCC